ncbi:MAG: threonine-phosphate decarboxylase [Firmicutes bacterium]|nr:threonine-phosphate decarboxylase [Bacillota bacterium]
MRGHGGNVWAAAARLGCPPEEILDFSASLNPLGPPSGVLKAVKEAMRRLRYYPEPGARAFREAVAAFRGVDPDHVIAGNGSAELLFLLPRVLKPARVVAPVPSFASYEDAAGAAGLSFQPFPLDPGKGFTLDSESARALAASILPGDLLFLADPNNPTGIGIAREDLLFLAGEAERIGFWLVLDESFIDFARDSLAPEIIAAGLRRTVVVGSLTKIFALPGLRIGFAVGDPGLLGTLELARDPWSVNVLAVEAGRAALARPEFVTRTRRFVARRRPELSRGLSLLGGLQPLPSEVNFLLVDGSGTGISAADLSSRLFREKILIRDCANFRNLTPAYFRVSIQGREENARLLRALEAALGAKV